MFDSILNILTLGIRPVYKKQKKFHDLIVEYRTKFANPGRAHFVKSDLEEFYKKLADFNFDSHPFKIYYNEYIGHLERFNQHEGDTETTLSFLRIALAENKWKPTRPFPILVHHFKYRFRPTSKRYIPYQKKQQRKKLDFVEGNLNKSPKPGQSQKWQRVPLKPSKKKS